MERRWRRRAFHLEVGCIAFLTVAPLILMLWQGLSWLVRLILP